MALPSSSPPSLAQITVPQGFRYVLHAEDYYGFLVQRRYQRLPPLPELSTLPKEHVWYEPYLHPFVHPLLVEEAGYTLAEVTAWLAAHPGQAFTHPEYAPLCLRWGDNPYAYRVARYIMPKPPAVIGGSFWMPPPPPQPLAFTPYTVWSTGQTYYRLNYPVPADDTWLTGVGLRWHTVQEQEEGSWEGWYTLDWEVVQAVAAHAQTPRYAVLQQLELPAHGVRLYRAPGVLAEEQRFLTAELAWACYAAAAAASAGERSAHGAQMYPRLAIGWEQGPEGARVYADKAVAATVSLATLLPVDPPYLVPRMAWGAAGEPFSSMWWPLLPDEALEG
jgi:hypothetical protein